MASGESTAESTSREAIVRRSFLERPAPETESGSFSNWTRKASYASSSSRLAPAPPLEAFRLVCLPLRMVHQYVLESTVGIRIQRHSDSVPAGTADSSPPFQRRGDEKRDFSSSRLRPARSQRR